MANELVQSNLEQLPVMFDPTSGMVAEMTRSVDFLERIQLFTKGSAIDRGLIAPGHYGIPKGEDHIVDLGVEIDVIPLCARPKAIDLRDKEAIVTNYEYNSDTFQDIKERSGEQNSGCMYGLCFLVAERSTGQLYELFCGTKSMRQESGKISGYLPLSAEQAEKLEVDTGKPHRAHGPLACTLKVKYVKKNNWAWHVPICVQCSTPFNNMPSLDYIKAEVERFVTAKSTDIEKVEEAPTGKKRAR